MPPRVPWCSGEDCSMRAAHPKVSTKWMAGRIVQNWTAEEDAVLLRETLQCEEEYGKKL